MLESFSSFRRLLLFLFIIAIAALIIPPPVLTRDPHPRKVRMNGGNGGSTWVTPQVYGSLYGERLRDVLSDDDRRAYCRPGVWDCDCFFKPAGPINTWVKVERGYNPTYGDQCYAPPYATSGDWWTWVVSQIENRKNGLQADIDQMFSVGVFLGVDGEGRPLKSGDGWRLAGGGSGAEMEAQFNNSYVPAVINKVLDLYPGKTIRSQTDADFKDLFLEAGIDFHRESLAADEQHAYLYEGLQWTGMGWWQGFADHFWVTNSLGLGQQWPPLYISTLGALSKHTDGMTGGLDWWQEKLTPAFSEWAKSYMARDLRDTPGVWTFLRDTNVRKKEWYVDWGSADCGAKEHLYENYAGNYSGKYGDYDFYLYRPEKLEGNQTVAVKAIDLPAGTNEQIYGYRTSRSLWVNTSCEGKDGIAKSVQSSLYVGRKVTGGSRYMSVDIDDGYLARYAGQAGVSWNFRIVFLDQGSDIFKLQYQGKDGQWREKQVTKTNTNLWKEITINVTDAVFNNSASQGAANGADYPTDFRLDFGNPTIASIIHFIEVSAKGGLAKEEVRPKAQVSADLIRNKGDDPQKGIYSVGLNQIFWVKATLMDNQGNPIPNERIMFTYNTEWNLAKSALTDQNGVAYQWFSTANNPNSSGFLAGGSDGYKASSYSVQAYFPGSEKYQPSRNDAKLWVTDSPSPTDTRNLRMEIKDISPVQLDGKVKVTYQLYNPAGPVGGAVVVSIGRKEGFYADDPDVQTISIFGLANGHFGTSGHVTPRGNVDGNPAKVEGVEVSNGPTSDKVVVNWKKNPEANIGGYRIFYGTESGKYTNVLGVGNANSATISNLIPGKGYYFSVRAHSVKAYEGEYSAEVSKTLGNTNNPNTLRVIKVGLGSGTITGTGINCGPDCEESFASGTNVTLSATADGASVFAGWSGDCMGTGTCTVTMNASRTITAQFNDSSSPSPNTYTLSASAAGGGTVTPSGAVTVTSGASKTFSITANAGYAISDVKV
ncbi:MAG: fibronectin type III domain-containing protein, partial [Deltaproteobacteria bacterium]|nr:fibronectin type III domain-containing protein [Deltaproteobacteria bacterium]